MVKRFTEEVKQKCLLWSDRHCCLCDKACGTDIEIAHIDPKGENGIGNAIPLCYDCHAEIGRYNKEHPRGNKYRPNELKTRREQIYERYTRHLVPPLLYGITQAIRNNPKNLRLLPDVGFNITHLGDSIPVRVKVEARVFLGARDLGLVQSAIPYYSGETIWNLNPRLTFYGHFSVPDECAESDERLGIEVTVIVIDPYEREHNLLPICYRYVRKENYWYLDPAGFEELKCYIE
jgi:hypothetical protein